MTESYDAIAQLEEIPNLLPSVRVDPHWLTFGVAYKRLSSQAPLGASLKFLIFDQARRVEVDEPLTGPDPPLAPRWPRYGEPPWRLDNYEGSLSRGRKALRAGRYSGVALIDGRRSRFVQFEATESGFPEQPSLKLDFFSTRPLEARVGRPGEPDLLIRTQYPPNHEALEEAHVMTPFSEGCVVTLDGSDYPRDVPNMLIDVLYNPGQGSVLHCWCHLDEFHVPYAPGEHRVSVSLKDESGRVFVRSEEQVIRF